MDRRDHVAMYGASGLASLPEVDVDLNNMTAVFYTEPDLGKAPGRPKSDLEKRGEEIDAKLGEMVDRLIDKLIENGMVAVEFRGTGEGFYHHFPKSVTKSWDENGNYWTFLGMLRDSLSKRTLDQFFHLYVSVERGPKKWPADGTRHPHRVLAEMTLGLRASVRTKDGTVKPYINIWFHRNANKVLSFQERYLDHEVPKKAPFQFGVGHTGRGVVFDHNEAQMSFFDKLKNRAKKGWSLIETGGISFARIGRRLNRMVHGEPTKDQLMAIVRSWFEQNGHNVSQWPRVEANLIEEAKANLGDWVLNFLEPEAVEHTLHLKWQVCGTCNGKGTHVNPSIDSHGLTREDFDEDPEFKEEYFSGMYDVSCYECQGRTTTLVIDRNRTSEVALKAADSHIKDHHDYIRECEAERRMGA